MLTETKRLEIYNATTGGLVRTLPVAAGAAPRDIQGLEIEQPWVVYAWNVYRAGKGSAPGKEIGNLAFVPLARVDSLLG